MYAPATTVLVYFFAVVDSDSVRDFLSLLVIWVWRFLEGFFEQHPLLLVELQSRPALVPHVAQSQPLCIPRTVSI